MLLESYETELAQASLKLINHGFTQYCPVDGKSLEAFNLSQTLSFSSLQRKINLIILYHCDLLLFLYVKVNFNLILVLCMSLANIDIEVINIFIYTFTGISFASTNRYIYMYVYMPRDGGI